MAKSSKLQVMISSRCNDLFPLDNSEEVKLSDIRRKLKREIEEVELFGKKIFDVWINEEVPPKGGNWDSLEVCLQAVKDCDILLVLYNGNAGWATNQGNIGICHAELKTGLSQAPGKVRLISLEEIPIDNNTDSERNRLFQAEVAKQNLFRGGMVKDEDELIKRTKETLHDVLITLAQLGVRESSKGRFHSGQALDWNRMDFNGRQREMKRVIKDLIIKRRGSSEDDGNVFVKLNNINVLLFLHAIPAALSIGAAKEMVGQPFLNDYKSANILTKNRAGPVHIIACHKTATESQATKILGFPDATVVSAPFGIYVSDNVQKVQFAFIVNCRDEANTRHGVERFFDWLDKTGEVDLMAKRARSRAKIVKTIAKEIGDDP